MISAHKILVGNSEFKKTSGRPRCGLDDNIKINFK
jgi:hypothetical protein